MQTTPHNLETNFNDPRARGGHRRYLDSVVPEEYRPYTGEVSLSEMSLTGLADLYGSDKGSIKHFYTRHYEKVIDRLLLGVDRQSARITLGEVGVACGASLRMWANYLPSSEIYGFDIRPECALLCQDLRNVKIIIQDLVKEDLSELAFDIFIDDASHISEDIEKIFFNSWPRVKPGGYYIVEDLRCTYNAAYASQYTKTFGVPTVNDRRVVINLIDQLMRIVDSHGEITEILYYPQMLVLKKLKPLFESNESYSLRRKS